jgi:hypothetical protein
MYDDFREGSKDPNALIRPSAATAAACDSRLVILRSHIFGSFSPADHSGRTSYTGVTQVRVYTDASREGFCGFCHCFFFTLYLTVQWAALPMAVL